jgi:hypothetical protein
VPRFKIGDRVVVDRIEVTASTDLRASNGGQRTIGYVKGERGVVVDPTDLQGRIRIRFDSTEIIQFVLIHDLRLLDIVDLIGEV